jgi:predicted dehydrogenase
LKDVETLNEKSLRFGVIGLGKMGLLHASILSTIADVKLTALCEKSALTRRLCKKLFGNIHIADDLEEMCDLGLDAVYVTTPILSHLQVVRSIYSNRIARNIFVEKTLAAHHNDSKELCQISQSSGGTNMVGYMKRFAVAFAKANDLLKQNALGDVSSFEAYACSSDFSTWKSNQRASASRGGVLGDLGSHVIDLALWFFGDFDVSSAETRSLSSEDTVDFKVEKSNRLKGQFHISWCEEGYRMPEFGFLIHGSKGILNVNDDEVELQSDDEKSMWYRHDLNDNVDFLLGGPEYFREDEYFAKAISSRNPVEPCFSTASKVDYIIEQVRTKTGGTL